MLRSSRRGFPSLSEPASAPSHHQLCYYSSPTLLRRATPPHSLPPPPSIPRTPPGPALAGAVVLDPARTGPGTAAQGGARAAEGDGAAEVADEDGGVGAVPVELPCGHVPRQAPGHGARATDRRWALLLALSRPVPHPRSRRFRWWGGDVPVMDSSATSNSKARVWFHTCTGARARRGLRRGDGEARRGTGCATLGRRRVATRGKKPGRRLLYYGASRSFAQM